MRGTIRSGSLAAYCVHSPRGAKRLDRLNLHSRTGEITAARHPEAARESNQGLATARALGLNAPLFYELRPELHAGWLPGLFGADQGIGARGGMPPASVVPVGENQVSRPDTRLRRIMIFGPRATASSSHRILRPKLVRGHFDRTACNFYSLCVGCRTKGNSRDVKLAQYREGGEGGRDGMSVHSAKLPESQLIGIPAPGDEQPGSWPRSMLVEMDDKFTTAVREAFAAGNERATAAAATVVTARAAAGSRRGLGTVTDLLLRRAQAGRAGAQGDDDYDVIDAGGLVIGRIFKANKSPAETPWMWTLAYGDHKDRPLTHGYESTRQAAMQAFARSGYRET